MDKAELLRRLDAEHRQTLELLRSVDPELVVYEESGWRVKDIIAHVATWDAETLRSFHALRRGGSYSIPDYTNADDFNAFVAHVRMDEPMARILADWEATRNWMMIIFRAMSEDEFDGEMTYPSGKRGVIRNLVEEIFGHEVLHRTHIEEKVGIGS